MKISARITTMFISILALLNVIFVPLFVTLGGLYPRTITIGFTEAFQLLYDDFGNWQLWEVQFIVLLFIPAAFMLLTTLLGSKGLFILSSLFGVAMWIIEIVIYSSSDFPTNDIMDFKNGSIAIGVWIALILFIFGFLAGLVAKKKETVAESN